MIEAKYKAEHKRLESTFDVVTPGKSPADVSFEKTNEIYAILAEPLKKMRY